MSGLLEYSVVYTDRALNHMSASFQEVMRDISTTLVDVYAAEAVVVVPGSGTAGMEAVARQYANDEDVLIVRNGLFSHRWLQILETGRIARNVQVLSAAQVEPAPEAPFAPPAIDEVVDRIRTDRPAVVFAPHVETSAGMMLPDDYIAAMAAATHEVDGLLVIDCIASGAMWLDMASLGIDVVLSAPQKGWSGPPCAGLVLLGPRAVDRLGSTSSSSFTLGLDRWRAIMVAYEQGGHAYHATMPTDALREFRDVMHETVTFGLARARDAQLELGGRIRGVLRSKGFASVASPGFEAPGVVVCHTDDPSIRDGSAFVEQGMQIAAGVPLHCGEPDDFSTFRIGLFGLDKLYDVDGTVGKFTLGLNAVMGR